MSEKTLLMIILYILKAFCKEFTSRWSVHGWLKTLIIGTSGDQSTHFRYSFLGSYRIEGKDSYAMLHILHELRRRAPIDYELIAVNVDSGYPGYRKEVLEDHLKETGLPYHMETTDCYAIIESKRRPGSSYCSFCARLRRGVLYTLADKLGCNKIALGHHLDDFIETLLLNQFYIGTLGAMSPKLLADNGRHTVIRPLVYVEEADIIKFARQNEFPVICCACPVCGQVDQKRKRMKALIRELHKENRYLKKSLIRSLANVKPRHLLDQYLVRTDEMEIQD